MLIAKAIYDSIIEQFPLPAPPEYGGFIGWKNGIIIAFQFDEGLPVAPDRAFYQPNPQRFAETLCRFEEQGIQFCGLLHSHPVNSERLSDADILFAQELLVQLPDSCQFLYFPIIIPTITLVPYAIYRNGVYQKDSLIFV